MVGNGEQRLSCLTPLSWWHRQDCQYCLEWLSVALQHTMRWDALMNAVSPWQTEPLCRERWQHARLGFEGFEGFEFALEFEGDHLRSYCPWGKLLGLP